MTGAGLQQAELCSGVGLVGSQSPEAGAHLGSCLHAWPTVQGRCHLCLEVTQYMFHPLLKVVLVTTVLSVDKDSECCVPSGGCVVWLELPDLFWPHFGASECSFPIVYHVPAE